MEIHLFTGEYTGLNHSRTSATLTGQEQDLLSVLLKKSEQDSELSKLLIFSRRSENYLTVSVGENYDFLRIKATPRALWFSVQPAPEDKQSPLLDCVEKKNLVHWKIKLNSLSDAERYADIVYRSALNAKKYYSKENKNV